MKTHHILSLYKYMKWNFEVLPTPGPAKKALMTLTALHDSITFTIVSEKGTYTWGLDRSIQSVTTAYKSLLLPSKMAQRRFQVFLIYLKRETDYLSF